MTTFQPIYELTVYAAKSVDPTETTVLTPAAGAPHSDPFVLSTVQNVAGTKPYLDYPTNRSASIDPLNKTATVGTITLTLLDSRTTPGGSNAERWVTAFVGDGAGGNMLLGRLVKIRESLDNGASYSTYAVGRITDTQLNGKLKIQITVRDRSDDLNVDVYVGKPAFYPGTEPLRQNAINGRAVGTAYSHLAQVAPIGLLHQYGSFPLTTPLRGTVSAVVDDMCVIKVYRDGKSFAGIYVPSIDASRSLITQALMEATLRAASTNKTDATGLLSVQPPKIYIATSPTGTFKEYNFDYLWSHFTIPQGTRSTSLDTVLARVVSDALPSVGATVYFYVEDPVAPASSRTPVLIDDVSFTDHLADLCAGKFGRLDSDGKPIRSVPFDANGVDGSKRVPWRRPVSAPSKLRDEIEAICRAYHVAFYQRPDGTITLVDLRRSSTTATVATITDDDLVETKGNLTWRQSRDEAVTAVLGTYYAERQIAPSELPQPFQSVPATSPVPDIPTVCVDELAPLPVFIPQVTKRSPDVKPQTFKADVKGFRFVPDAAHGEQLNGGLRTDQMQGHFVDYATELAGPFGLGPSDVEIICRRGSSNASAVTPGTWAQLSLSALPDPATNRRGGNRLGLCLSRTDQGLQTRLKFLDGGANSVALVPTLGAPSSSGTAQSCAIAMAVTLNALLEPARISYAITSTSVAVRPADDDPSWVNAAPSTVTGTFNLQGLPSGARLWMRGRSEPPAGAGFKLPSVFAYPSSGTGYADTPAMTAPSGVALTSPTAGQSKITWTNGESWAKIDVYLVQGSTPGTWTDAMRVATLDPGTTTYLLTGYPLLASTGYAFAVAHRDDFGGTSALATGTGTTGAAGALAAPSSPFVFAGSQDAGVGLPNSDGLYGLAVVASVFPGYVEFAEEVETSPGSGTYGTLTTVGKVAAVQGFWTIWQGTAPNDGKRRRLSARSVRDGDTSSSYTTALSVLPWTPQVLPVSALVVQPTPGPTSYSIAWSGTGTITLSIDGGTYSIPAASPIVVARDGSDHTYAFRSVGLQTVTDVVVVPSLEKDTVTPDLTVTPGTPTATTQPYSVVAANPAGGAAPTLSVTCTGCTMTVGATTYPDGTTLGITTGTTVTANRPSSTTTTQAKLKFDAAISGGGLESIVVDVTPQLNLGPSLQVNATPGPTSYSIAWTGTGTITVSIDGASFGTPAASPIPVTRDSSDHTYTFKAIADGQEIRQTVGVPALPATAGALPVIDTFFTPSNGLTSTSYAQNTTTDRIDLRWTAINIPAGATFDLVWALGGGATTRIVGVTSPYAHAKTGTGGHGLDLVNGGTFEDMRYTLLMLDSSGHEVASRGLDAIVDHA